MSKLFKGLLLIALLAAPRWAFAYSWQELAGEFKPTFTGLDGVVAVYGKDLENGRNAGGAADPFWTTANKVLSLNAGLMNTVDTGKDVGAFGIGPSVNFFYTIKFLFPEFSDRFISYIPKNALPFTDRLSIGYLPTWNLNDGVKERFSHYIFSGISFKWGGN